MELTLQQLAIVHSESKRVVVTGGHRSGKTVVALKRAELHVSKGARVAYLLKFKGQCKLFTRQTSADIKFIYDVDQLDGTNWDGVVIEDFHDTYNHTVQVAVACLTQRQGWLQVQGLINPLAASYKAFRDMCASYEVHTLPTMCTRAELDRCKFATGVTRFNCAFLNIWPTNDGGGI